jgi:hypothetical protein
LPSQLNVQAANSIYNWLITNYGNTPLYTDGYAPNGVVTLNDWLTGNTLSPKARELQTLNNQLTKNLATQEINAYNQRQQNQANINALSTKAEQNERKFHMF